MYTYPVHHHKRMAAGLCHEKKYIDYPENKAKVEGKNANFQQIGPAFYRETAEKQVRIYND